mgnify:CR=1 FL=1
MWIFLFILITIFIILTLAYIIFVSFFIFFDIKNKVFSPSEKRVVEEFFKNYPFKENGVFFDLGSEDGRIVFLAEKKGLKAYGVENNPTLYFLSKFLKRIKKSKEIFIRENMKKINLDNADYVYIYLLPKFIEEIENG